jgi:hypothetical protein
LQLLDEVAQAVRVPPPQTLHVGRRLADSRDRLTSSSNVSRNSSKLFGRIRCTRSTQQ